MLEVLSILIGYLIGSAQTAVVVSRSRGIDIYQAGSGNPGASNAFRVLGKKYGAMVMLADLVKGAGAAGVGELMGGSEAIGFMSGAAAVVGHCFPIWHRFRGGKGVATAVGMVVWLIPLLGLALGILWGLVIGASRVAAYGSLLVMVIAVVGVGIWAESSYSVWVMAGVAALVWIRHTGNIRRILQGGEKRL